jgi:hypothetical protein
MQNKIHDKNIILSLFLALTIFSFFSFASAETVVCNPSINLVNQDPNPAIPESYMTVLFEVTDLSGCDGYSVRLSPNYPFSRDTNESLVRSIASIPYAKDAKNSWMVSYKLKVDKDAMDGDYSLKLQFEEGSDGYFNVNAGYAEKGYIVSIQDSRTSFDAVIQESSSSEVSIAIANIGKYTANSVVVRIPEQDSFTVSGTDGQMVGNIDSGDYTIVGFTIAQKMSSFESRNTSKGSVPQNSSASSKLKFDIYYTDNLGERRTVNMELLFKMGNVTIPSFGGARKTTTSSWYSSWLLWIIVVAVFGGIYFAYKKYPNKFQFLNSKKKDSASVPDWVKKAKEKK